MTTSKEELAYQLVAETCVTPERYGAVALAEIVEFPTLFEMPDATA